MRRALRLIRCLLACVPAFAATGCGYSMKSLHPEGINTVYVEMFQSKEFRRGLEMQLTEALVKEISARTPYRNAPKKQADTLLTGEIIEVKVNTLGKDFARNLPREQVATLVVSFRWKDMRTGRMLAEKDQFAVSVEYVPPAHETFYQGSEDAVNRMARAIVNSMETGW